MCITDALHEKISFSTAELAHHPPEEGCAGFWGHFTLKENPTFDPKDSKSSKFVRQYHVKRSDILVYNVQVSDAHSTAQHSLCDTIYMLTIC